MRHFEESLLANNWFRPLVWFKYVDDTFSVIWQCRHRLKISRFSQDILTWSLSWKWKRTEIFHPSMSVSSVITFLNTVHHKTTFTGPQSEWNSFTPRKHKINLIRTLTYRWLSIFSKFTLLQRLYLSWRISCFKNSYPRELTVTLMMYSTNIRTGPSGTGLPLHTAGAREIWIDQWGFSKRKKFTVLKSGNFSHWR